MHVWITLISLWSALSFGAPPEDRFDGWIDFESKVAAQQILASFSSPDAAPGAIYASPSRENPEYFRHWVRDAALVMNTALTLAERSDSATRNRIVQGLIDYVRFSRGNQLTNNPSGTPADGGLGEPWFYMNGAANWKGWGRPQLDGPALRAITLIRFANLLLDAGQEQYVRAWLYDGRIPAETVIKADLEFVSHHWHDHSYDLWEEIRGYHFYTRIVQRRALLEGAKLARRLGDWGAGDYYQVSGDQLTMDVHSHWRPERGYFIATFDHYEGIDYKNSGLDIAIVLGALHTDGPGYDKFLTVADPRIQATAQRLRDDFAWRFGINSRDSDFEGRHLGPAMGRYPEDRFNGYVTTSLGNPWFLAGHAMAELYYRSAREYQASGRIDITGVNLPFFRGLSTLDRDLARSLGAGTLTAGSQAYGKVLRALRDEGDSFLARTRAHASSDGHLSEEMNRDTGFMQGANDLTWSYASFLTASWAR